MKRISLKLFLIVPIILLFFFIPSGATEAEDEIVISTTGYSVLSPSSFIFGGSYSGNIQKRGFTTYFEYKKNDSNLNKEEDREETIKIERRVKADVDGVFYTSPELNIFATYFFRAVGYFNDRPNEKFYGNVLSLKTGPTFDGTIPFTAVGVSVGAVYNGAMLVEPFDPVQVLAGAFVVNANDTTATIKTIIQNKNPDKLNLRLEYTKKERGEFDLETELLSISKSGNIAITLKDLEPETKYYFRLYDTEKKLKESNEGQFTTTKTTSNDFIDSDEVTDSKDSNTNTDTDTDTDSATDSSPILLSGSGADNSSSTGGLVKCGKERYPKGTYMDKNKEITTSKTDSEGKKNIDVSGMVTIENQCGFKDLFVLIDSVIKFILIIAVPLAAVMFAYAGFELLTSGGSPEKKTKAKSIFINVAIGLILVAAAFVIIKTVLSIVGYDQSWNWFGF